jgi:prophage regulatory protein
VANHPAGEQKPTLIRLPEVKRITGLGKSSIYARCKEGRFPSPINLGGRMSAWCESEVLQWVREIVAASRGVEVRQ